MSTNATENWKSTGGGKATERGEPIESRPSTQSGQATASGNAPQGCPRAVLFATGRAAPDLPVPAETPAALLPLGHAPLITRLVEQLARVGVVDVDLVAGDRPEALRSELGDGERWGLRLHWRLAKLDERPYGVLAAPAIAAASRVIVGHADGWLDPEAFTALAHADTIVHARDGAAGLAWTGWASAPGSALAGITEDTDEAALEREFARACPRSLVLQSTQAFRPLDAASLLGASRSVIQGSPDAPLPAAWIPKPWGAISPGATLHPGASVIGPVLIGPGCLVDEGASIGPNAILSRDVIVSAGTVVRDSLVLPRTYLGRDLELGSAVVNGDRIRDAALGVEVRLVPSDALALSLGAPRGVRPSMAGRLSAAVAAALLAPLVGAAALLRPGQEPALPWSPVPVVLGVDRARRPLIGPLRCPRSEGSALREAAALVGSLLDVAQGRRSWFGVRPRPGAEWQAVNAQWQRLISSAPVGVLHAPAWAEDGGSRQEALAAADAFYAVRRGWRENLRLATGVLRNWRGLV